MTNNGRFENPETDFQEHHKTVGVKHNDLLTLNKRIQVKVFELDHSVPAVGYGFIEHKTKLRFFGVFYFLFF